MTLAVAGAYGFRGLVLDTTRVTFCDSALLDTLRQWRRGRRLRLIPSRAVTRLLQVAQAASCGLVPSSPPTTDRRAAPTQP